MAFEKIAPYSTEHPMKVRDDDGNVMMATYDSNVNAKLDQLANIMGQLLTVMNGIRARLDAGINTKAVASLAAVNL